MGGVEKQRSTDQRARRQRLPLPSAAALALAAALTLTACTITLPATETPATAPSAPPPTFAPPTVVAGYDAKAIAGAPMTFEAGNSLRPDVPVAFHDILGEPVQAADYTQTPGPPEWKLLVNKVGGQTRYSNASGCQLTYWTTTRQGPLIAQGDDRASTVALMKYLLPSVMESSLGEAQLPWTAEAGKAGPGISFLAFGTKAGKDVMASTVWARVLGTADTGLLLTLACPTDELLAATTPKVMTKLSVAPPSN